MRIIIRAVRERQQFVDYLTEKLPHAEWCFDQTKNALDTFASALQMANNDAVVHMEEDTILTDNFIEKLHTAIQEHPNNVIQFFSMRKADIEVGSRWDNHFLMTQCFYMPPTYSAQLLTYYPTWEAKKLNPGWFDVMVQEWLKLRREKYWIHVPSLVDHRVAVSAIDKRRSSKRQSKTFQ